MSKDVAQCLGYKDAFDTLKKHVGEADKQNCQNDSFETPRGFFMKSNTTSPPDTKLQVFANPEFGEIRSVLINGEPWLIGKDVAKALGYKEPSKAAREKVDPEDRGGVSKIDTPSGTQTMTIINESGLYALILSSKLTSAKKFKRWVTSEVLPAIRKTN